jgi:SM-20-related protein
VINPSLPVSVLKDRFARDSRVQIDSILEPDAAQALYNCLREEIPWELVFRRGGEVVTLTAADLDRLQPNELAQMTLDLQRQARSDFQFVYWKFSMVDAYRRRQAPELVTHRLLESLACAETIDLVREITGITDIRRVDAQATLYRSGNFLTAHSDEQEGQYHRRAAYVIQLCKDWRSDWGGLLHFLDAKGDVTHTFTPGFNRMSLFRVPQEHAVSMVTPFAGGPRFGITGWFTA